ncbi:phosphonate transporter PhnE [Desulfolithobacter dissulfuricans]|uniref:Phosphonate transporter PhnE n=1 Tax=Desulfolithobacter dissulfuricans TaxID=2795293 RepID=A0A915XJ18_9BACT|nr:phosphonate ABC transporter, permease protein PhnE [Desulfolithobacter dissulfuricans]BCO10399.1 phosphonate transporter PhnE [Desulfolithobacter dissulfuricans]
MSTIQDSTPADLAVSRLKRSSTPFRWQTFFVAAILAAVFLTSWFDTGMSIGSLLGGAGFMRDYLVGNPEISGSAFFPPTLILSDIRVYVMAMIETLEMAVVALFFSILVAVPLSLFASRNILRILLPGHSLITRTLRTGIYLAASLVANVFRSINEIVWALFFVSAVGLGPMAGILALAVHTAGVLCKLLAEGNEAIDPGPVEALSATGAGFLKIITFAVVPQTMPHFISMVLYRFESDVRSASILGFVGAGGIGFYLFDKVRSFENGDVTTIIIIIVVTVWLIDKLSAYIREKFI